MDGKKSLSETVEEPSPIEGMDALEDFQRASVAEIESVDRKLTAIREGVAVFVEPRAKKGNGVLFRVIPVDRLSSVADDLIRGATEHGEYLGFVVPSKGFAEFTIRASRGYTNRRVIEKYDWVADESTCGHEFAPTSPTRPTRSFGEGPNRIGFHVASPKEKACVELSPTSATANFLLDEWHVPPPLGLEGLTATYSLKVFLDDSRDPTEVTRRATEIAARTIFELDVRNGIPLVLLPRERMRVSFELPEGPTSPKVRFPKLKTPREVAALFSFASEAWDNPPFIFLSYYQVLEYFLPLAHRRDGIRTLRQELKDPFFDEGKDSSVLRLITSIERFKQASEEDQLKVLLRDFTREEKLKEFFATEDLKHFSEGKGAPISGISGISLHPKSDALSLQVAKRIYALRNRIVHAKDDPKFAPIPVLLPRSREANNLKPDITLVRLLATEVLIHSQD
ncbi:hypothetical protein [Streptomyces sp. LKA04]|uniref:hypothetical protein n=1 Tax=Streptomyces sp. LKA04 TaxID=3398092 RepID=UPI003A8120BD